MKKLLFFCFFIPISYTLYAQHGNYNVNIDTRKVWIQNKINEIKKSGLYVLPVVEPEINETPDFTNCFYNFIRDARITFPDKSRIDIFLHSSHSNPTIGDVSIAITDKGKAHVNYGHICGGTITFFSKKPTAPENTLISSNVLKPTPTMLPG
ncbi:MAG: hypothetical protein BWY70_01188 [Bacteroidetes bacterium ADurb.Bin408]|nr:MAG: hypothetical protein BWY70_01188 [Bacteroidetes bacterium ADurb.Bin408]